MRFSLIVAMVIAVIFAGSEAETKGNNLKVIIKKENVDLTKNTITFTLNRVASYAEIQVFNLDGEMIGENTKYYDSPRPNTPLEITWPKPIEDEKNFKLAIKFVDDDDFWITWEIVHFYGLIPHKEVNFETAKWEILDSERPKLDVVIPDIIEMIRKFKKIGGEMDYGLYVAGHTDTVDTKAYNRDLSQKRARAIAQYFLNNGLRKEKISIYIRGFGEEALLIKTDDSVNEKRNRRADYIISNFKPIMAGPGSWIKIN